MNQKYRTLTTYNLDKIKLSTDKDFDMPVIQNDYFVPIDLISFNYAIKNKSKCVAIHFYIDDYQFERLWNHPEKYVDIFKKYGCILSPDFSLYLDMPLPMKIWNTYRSRFLGQYYQKQGIKVIPTISWADSDTYSFCFKGIPKGSIVSISTVGVRKNKKATELWKKGVDEMIKQINPSIILVYGSKIDYDFKSINVRYYKNHNVEKINKIEKKDKIC